MNDDIESSVWKKAYEDQTERHQEAYSELLHRHLDLIRANGETSIANGRLRYGNAVLSNRLRWSYVSHLFSVVCLGLAFMLDLANGDFEKVFMEVANLVVGGIILLGGLELIKWSVRKIREQRARKKAPSTASDTQPGNPGHDAEEGNAHSHEAEGIRQGRTEEAEGLQGARA